MVKFCLTLFVIAGIGWYIQENADFAKIKKDTINVLQNEKTINTVNTKRASDQADVYEVTNR